jgi:hypothetical protein
MQSYLRSGQSQDFTNCCKCFNINRSSHCGRVAQLGEHLLCKQGVAGSIPATSTKFLVCLYWVSCLCVTVSEFV